MIRFESVSHVFPDGTRALDDVSLEVPARSTTATGSASGLVALIVHDSASSPKTTSIRRASAWSTAFVTA